MKGDEGRRGEGRGGEGRRREKLSAVCVVVVLSGSGCPAQSIGCCGLKCCTAGG